jgi:hypothetical protein
LKFHVLLFHLIFGLSIFAQSDTTRQKAPEISFSGYADVFYAFDFSMPTDNKRQPYLVNHNRHNEFNVNHVMVQAEIKYEKYRANLGLHMGTYVQDNYAQEPSVLKYIYQGNVGLSLSKKNKLWLDVGIFESHIGFEVAQSTENQTLTRSLCAELSPYYFGGAKLSYDPNERWAFKLLALNGWQRIQRLSGNSLLSFGSQIQFKPNAKWLVNWSTFVGTDTPDSARLMRYFSNFYTQFKPNEKLNFTLGWDVGLQQLSMFSSNYNYWTNITLIGQYKLFTKWKTALRLEYFKDEFGLLLSHQMNYGQHAGLSWNLDYSPSNNFVMRWENRLVHSFAKSISGQTYSRSNFVSVLSLALKFGK